VTVPAVAEVDARHSYEVGGLRDGTKYGFRLYSSASGARRSQSSTRVVVTTADNGQSVSPERVASDFTRSRQRCQCNGESS